MGALGWEVQAIPCKAGPACGKEVQMGTAQGLQAGHQPSGAGCHTDMGMRRDRAGITRLQLQYRERLSYLGHGALMGRMCLQRKWDRQGGGDEEELEA